MFDSHYYVEWRPNIHSASGIVYHQDTSVPEVTFTTAKTLPNVLLVTVKVNNVVFTCFLESEMATHSSSSQPQQQINWLKHNDGLTRKQELSCLYSMFSITHLNSTNLDVESLLAGVNRSIVKTPVTQLCCRVCSAALTHANCFHQQVLLPSEHWLELADLWTCETETFQQFDRTEVAGKRGTLSVGTNFLVLNLLDIWESALMCIFPNNQIVSVHDSAAAMTISATSATDGDSDDDNDDDDNDDTDAERKRTGSRAEQVSSAGYSHWMPCVCHRCNQVVGVVEKQTFDTEETANCRSVRLYRYAITSSASEEEQQEESNLFAVDTFESHLAQHLYSLIKNVGVYRFVIRALETLHPVALIHAVSWDSTLSTSMLAGEVTDFNATLFDAWIRPATPIVKLLYCRLSPDTELQELAVSKVPYEFVDVPNVGGELEMLLRILQYNATLFAHLTPSQLHTIQTLHGMPDATAALPHVDLSFLRVLNRTKLSS